MARYLAIDYGLRRVGLAWGDLEVGVAVPRKPIVCAPRVSIWRSLEEVVLEGDVCAFVVGLPLSADGEDSTWTVAVRAFAARLGKHFSMEVHFSDEYYTSQQIAEERLKLSRRKEKPHSRRRSGEDDSRTAVLILQDFFNDRSQPLGRSLI